MEIATRNVIFPGRFPEHRRYIFLAEIHPSRVLAECIPVVQDKKTLYLKFVSYFLAFRGMAQGSGIRISISIMILLYYRYYVII